MEDGQGVEVVRVEDGVGGEDAEKGPISPKSKKKAVGNKKKEKLEQPQKGSRESTEGEGAGEVATVVDSEGGDSLR